MARKKVPTEPRLKSWDEVNRAMKEIMECEGCIEEITVELNRTVAAAKEEADKKAKPAYERIKQLEYDIKEYTISHREEMEGKTKQLNFGRTGFRASTKLVVPPAQTADVIAALKRYGMDDCVTVKESVNKEALKRYASDDILKTGAYLKSTDEFWYEVEKQELQTSGVTENDVKQGT